MAKKGHLRRNWTRRLFRLDMKQGVLAYHKPQTMLTQEQTKGVIRLEGATVAPSTTFCEFVVTEKSTGREYHMRAESEEQCEQWLRSIQYAVSIAVPVLGQ